MMGSHRSGEFVILGTILLCVFINSDSLFAANFESGTAAYERGDYATALREFRVLAVQGYSSAQNNLGVMYAKGRGVPQDYTEAHKWYNLAAPRGHYFSRALIKPSRTGKSFLS